MWFLQISRVMDHGLTQSSDTLVSAPPPQTDIDKMFTGLGIDPFSFNNTKPDKPEPVMPAMGESAGSMSIEEKQR